MSRLDNLLDVASIQVENTPPPGTLVNELANPDGNLGVWAWRADSGVLTRDTYGGGIGLPALRHTTGSSGTTTGAFSELVPVTPGKWIWGTIQVKAISAAAFYVRPTIRFYKADGTFLSSAAAPAQGNALTVRDVASFVVPATAAQARLVLEISGTAGGGLTSPAAGKFVTWTSAALVVTDAELLSAEYGDIPAPTYTEVLGKSVNLGIQRRTFDHTMSATIRDAALDPAQVALLRTGRRLLVKAIHGDPEGFSYAWDYLFTGRVDKAVAAYSDLKRNGRPTITLTGFGPGAILAGTPEPRGVSTIPELPELMEGVRVPFRIDGSWDQGSTPVSVVSTNDQASLLDQIILCRDSDQAFVWVGADGILYGLRPRYGDTPRNPGLTTLTETEYSGLAVSWDPSTCVNTVTVIQLVINSVTGETEEVTWGPYTDPVSVRDNGVQAQEYRIHGFITPASFAQSILLANATPKRRVDSVRIPIRNTADLAALAWVDLYARVQITNADLGLDITMRTTGVDHTMDSQGRWYVDLTFEDETATATPQATTPLANNTPLDGVWYEIGAAGNPAFQNAWANVGAPNATAAYMRKNGLVHLKGTIQTGANGTAAFTLPAGFRPLANRLFATSRATRTTGAASAGTAHTHDVTLAAGRVTVTNTGNVSPQTGTGAQALDGICYPAEA